MELLTTTPFGRRPVTAALLEQAAHHQTRPAIPHVDKWELFRQLCTARLAYGVSDRDLTVLNALLSFHPEGALSDNGNLIVFPSNTSLSQRAHGMAESTLRRHVAALVQAGLIARHDSPNGKRYAARDADGGISRAFGFDLRPLLVQAAQISHAASEAEAAAARIKRLREDVTLRKRDALKLAVYGRETGIAGNWDAIEAQLLEIHKLARRKLDQAELNDLLQALSEVLTTIRRHLSETNKTIGSDDQNERHHQNSKTDSADLEWSKELDTPAKSPPRPTEPPVARSVPTLPLFLVLKACPDILTYTDGGIEDWHQLVSAAAFIRGMMGISPDAWREAQSAMGPEVAAIAVAGILQRVSEIRSPGGYLRALSRKAASTGFSPGPMIMALLTDQG